MKQIYFVAVLALLTASSCSHENENGVNEEKEVAMGQVRVRVSNFDISKEAITDCTTRTTENIADYGNAKAIVLAFYSGNTEVYKFTQYKDDPSTYTTFGEFSCNLQVGDYTMVTIAYSHFDGDAFVLTSPTEAAFTSERPRETFVYTQAVTITNTNPLDLDVTLKRISARLKIESTDVRPAAVTKIRITYAKGGKTFSPTTGLATSDAGFTQVNTPSSVAGAIVKVSSFPFLTSADDEEEKINITIDAMDANDNILCTNMVADVPLQRNYTTLIKGKIFTATFLSSLKIESSWEDEKVVNF